MRHYFDGVLVHTHLCAQVKYSLVEDVVRVLGIQRALELFNEVASIQDNGGEATVDGTRR